MPKISLASYSMRIREKQKKNDYRKLSNYSGGKDFIDSISAYLGKLKNDYDNHADEQKLFKVIEFKTDGRLITGLIETGEYGFETDLYDIKERKISHKRTTHEAELLPFYFLIYIPKTADEAVFISQRFGNMGIRALFIKTIDKHFKLSHPDLYLEVNPLIPKELAEQFLKNGRILKISLTSFTVPKDITDAFAIGHLEKSLGYAELVIHAKKKNSFPLFSKLKEYIDKKGELSKMFELKSFAYDTIKVQVKSDGNIRTIDLNDLQKVRAYYDITEEVKKDKNGHPNFHSINEIANELLDDHLEKMGIQ